MEMNPLDISQPGTARYRRLWELQGISQTEVAKLCRPKTSQAHVSQFERGTIRMSWKLAERLAPAYFAEVWSRNPVHAKKLVWQLWFINVEVGGTKEMQRFATEMRKKVERDIFTVEEETPLLAGLKTDAHAIIEIIPDAQPSPKARQA